MKKILNGILYTLMAGMVLMTGSCKKRDIKGEVITISNVDIALNSKGGEVHVPTGDNYSTTADILSVPLTVVFSDAVPKRFQVNLEVNEDTINSLIASNELQNTVRLSSGLYTLPQQLDVPFGVDSVTFNLDIDVTAVERNYGKNLAIAIELTDPTKGNKLEENNKELIVVINTSESISPDEIHYIYYTGANDLLQIPQPGVVYNQNATYLTVPVSVSLGGEAGKAFNVWLKADPDTVQKLLDAGQLSNTTLLEEGTDYILPDSIHYPANRNKVTFDMKIKVDVLKNNLGNKVALGLELDSADKHLLDVTRNTIVLQLDPINLVESDVTNMGSTLIVQRENSNENESSPKLVDNDINSKFLLGGFNGPVWMELRYDEPIIVNGYAMVSANDAPERDPKSWQILGSNDGIQWTVLDIQTSQSFLSRQETQKYNFDNSTPYLYYRLLITENNGSDLWQQAEWRLYKRPQ